MCCYGRNDISVKDVGELICDTVLISQYKK